MSENEITTVEAKEVPALPMGELLGDMSKLKATIAEKAYGIAVSELASWMVAQTAGRDLNKAREEIKRRATDSRFAEKAIYAKPIGNGKEVTGPSIWLLKQLANLAGHLDIATSVHSATGVETQITVKVVDKVSNNKRQFDLTVPHTQWRKGYYDRDAKQQIPDRAVTVDNPDLVKTIVLSAASKVERNVLHAAIDIELVQYAEECCRNQLEIDAATLLKNRKTCLEYFASKFRVTPAQVLQFLELREEKDITTMHVRRLKGLTVAIHEGEVNPADIWPDAVNTKTSKKAAAQAEAAQAVAKEEEENTEAPKQSSVNTSITTQSGQSLPQSDAQTANPATNTAAEVDKTPKPQPSVSTAENTATTGNAQTAPVENAPAESAPPKDTPEAASGEPAEKPAPALTLAPPIPTTNAKRGPRF